MQCFDCKLDSSFEEACGTRVAGGNTREVLFLHPCEIESLTIGYGGEVTDITMIPGTAPRRAVGRRDSVTTQETTNDGSGGSYAQTVVLNIGPFAVVPGAPSVDMEAGAQYASNFIDQLTQTSNDLIAIVQDAAGVYKAYGLNPLVTAGAGVKAGLRGLSASADKMSGAVYTDPNQVVITLTGGASKSAPVVTAAAIAALPVVV